jgi:two-component system, OmpR family, alkaline phosphatase synthesis response regulator PhoP
MITMPVKILIVDDEPDIHEFIGYNLRKEGYEVSSAMNGLEAVEQAKAVKPDLILLDVMMPGMDGIETCSRLRAIPAFGNCLIAFLTARGEDYSQIAGFDAGADEYITKPIAPRLLISRIKALLKRLERDPVEKEESGGIIKAGNLIIDKEQYRVTKKGKVIELPRKEFELLLLLVSRPGRVYLRDEIYNAVWGDQVVVGDRTIDVHIRKLREKIGDKYIKTVKGVGYKFSE